MEKLNQLEYIRLLKLKYRLFTDTERREFLLQEIENTRKRLLDENDTLYAKIFRRTFRWSIVKLNVRRHISIGNSSSNIKTVLLGIIVYSIIVFFFGICATVVYSINNTTELNLWQPNGLLHFVQENGLMPYFLFASKHITTQSYLIGLIGGSGAVVSLIKRFDAIHKVKSSFWVLFSKGLFNPVVGSLSAIAVVSFMSNTIDGIYLFAAAFFAGFSERILEKFENKFLEK